LHTTSSHPNRKAKRIVVTTITTLSKWRSAKFSGPNDEGGVEQAESTKIGNQASDGLIDGLAIFSVTIDELIMLVPAVAVSTGAGQFDESHSPFDKTASEETLQAEGLRVFEFGIESVEFFHRI